MPPYERPINMMFQSYALFPHMTVEQNIAFGLKQDGCHKAEIDARVEEMLKLVQMTQYARRKPHQLSGGQQSAGGPGLVPGQVGSCCCWTSPWGAGQEAALHHAARAGRDHRGWADLRHGDPRSGRSHDHGRADRHHAPGCIEQIGSPMDIYETPASRLVCEFIGSSTCLTACWWRMSRTTPSSPVRIWSSPSCGSRHQHPAEKQEGHLPLRPENC